jgi:hypothetical protein
LLLTLWIDESVGVIKVDPASGRLPGHFYSILAKVFFLAENITNIYCTAYPWDFLWQLTLYRNEKCLIKEFAE